MPKYPEVSSAYIGDLGVQGANFQQGSGARIQPFAITNYDGIVIESVLLPILQNSLRGGVSLFVEHRKAKGTDYAKYVSQGLDTLPVAFTLNLFRDYSQNPVRDWRAEYEKIEERLMPRSLDARNAIRIYHPSFAGRGIQQIIPTKEPILQPVGVDRWTVDVEGLDVRFVNSGPKGATKKVDQDDIHTGGGGKSRAIVGPAQRVQQIVGKQKQWIPG